MVDGAEQPTLANRAYRMRHANRLCILLIGPLPPPIGGTTVSFRQLVEDLRARDDVEIAVIDTQGRQCLLGKVRTWFCVVYKLLWSIRRVDVVAFHATSNGVFLLAPAVHVISRSFRKPWILRKFAGSFDQAYQRLPRWTRGIAKNTVLSADLCLFQTQHLVSFFRERCKHKVLWYANSRPMGSTFPPKLPHDQCRRFVFIGHVKPTKGIREIIAAGEQLDPAITVDIYGPLMDGIAERDFTGLKTVRYCGVLPPEEVIPTLRAYDALLMPTHLDGEGYPGVILEAYSAGIPVIATNCGAIPEILDETSGILIEPSDANHLLEAMRRLIEDPELYQTLCTGVRRKRDLFSSKAWTEKFVEYCRSVVTAGR